MGDAPNPYDWQSHNPRVEIARAEVDRIAATLAEGGSAVVLGGRGMGKSVTLRQIRKALEKDASTRVELIPAPPPELTVRACLDELAEVLGVPGGALRTRRILEAYFSRDGVPPKLVLLFDEFDRYAEKGDPSATPPGRGFFNDLDRYRSECLDPLDLEVEEDEPAGSPISSRFAVRSVVGQMSASIDHYLLRLPRR